MKTIIEPFRIKTVEPIKMTTHEERREILKRASWNLFRVPAEDILSVVVPAGRRQAGREQPFGCIRGHLLRQPK